ncbi:hypothetical protein GGF45_001307 [Coemansia sp. RSA 551]|nr:hypothetical protein GGF45_001307 [Coemansia sp. RSA 551]
MVFPNVILEQQRMEAAASYNIPLDPRTRGDLAVIVLLSVVYGIDLFAIVFMLWNRKYPPIKAKGPVLMACLFVCSVFWFIGDVQINGHAPLANSVFTSCRGFGIWVRVLLGICGVCAIVALRSYTLYYVFKLRLPSHGLRFYAPLIAYILCIIAFGIVASALHASASAEYLPDLDICRLAQPFKISVYAFVWATSVFVGLVNWHIRRIKSSFNEAREMFIACAIVLIVLTFNTCMQFVHPNYPMQLRFRIASTLLDHICCNALLWVIIGKPVLWCVFRRKTYLDKWTATLRTDGLQRMYEVESSGQTVELLEPRSGYKAHDFYYYNEPEDKKHLSGYAGAKVGKKHSGVYGDMPVDQMWQSEDNRLPTVGPNSPGHTSILGFETENSSVSWPEHYILGHANDRQLI